MPPGPPGPFDSQCENLEVGSPICPPCRQLDVGRGDHRLFHRQLRHFLRQNHRRWHDLGIQRSPWQVARARAGSGSKPPPPPPLCPEKIKGRSSSFGIRGTSAGRRANHKTCQVHDECDQNGLAQQRGEECLFSARSVCITGKNRGEIRIPAKGGSGHGAHLGLVVGGNVSPT